MRCALSEQSGKLLLLQKQTMMGSEDIEESLSVLLNLSVSVGTINGLLFYANMVKLNHVFFFPNGSVFQW